MRFLPLVLLVLCCCLPTGPTCDKPIPPELDLTVSAALVPNGDISIQWPTTTPTSPTDHWSKIDEGVATHDGATTRNAAGGLSGAFKVDKFSLQNVPADVGTITKIEWRAVALYNKHALAPDYDYSIEIYFYTGSTNIDTGGIPQGFQFTGLGDGIWHTFGWYSISGLSLTKAQGDDLNIWCIAGLPEPPGKNDRVELTAFEYRVTYTPAVVTSVPKHKMDIGLGMRPGLR